MPESYRERFYRLAQELADILRESDRPDELLAYFVSVLREEYGIDIRDVPSCDDPIVVTSTG